MIAALLLALGLGSAPSGGAPPAPLRDVATADVRFAAELGRLDPSRPRDYFELGELVAAESVDRADQMLAKRLYVLAYEIDRTSPKKEGLSAPACLALAALPPLSRERPWLLSLAATLDPRYVGITSVADEMKVPVSDGYRIAAGLGLLRAGESLSARGLLDTPESMTVLKRYERLLASSGAVGMLSRIRTELAKAPCPTCAGAHFTRSAGNADARKCPTCDALPAWKLEDDDFAAQVLLESRLLAGIHSSWGAQVLADDESPLREADPASVPGALGVDVKKSVYRDGAWVEPESAKKPGKGADTLAPSH